MSTERAPRSPPPQAWALWLEAGLTTALAAFAVACIPLQQGWWAFSWDALNHHIYLGLVAESPRWHLDVFAASGQGYQYPYLYWPVYRLSQLEISGAWAGALWSAGLAALVVPPLWVASWRLLPAQGSAAQAIFERSVAVALAMSSLLVLYAFGTTANDPLAATPLLWALAATAGPHTGLRQAALAAFLLGVAIAFKLSHVLAVPLLAVWWWQARRAAAPGPRALALAAALTLGYAVAYAPWGWQLWQQMGNPFYPLLSSVFGGS